VYNVVAVEKIVLLKNLDIQFVVAVEKIVLLKNLDTQFCR
jgi:hypothetical protein